MIVSIWFTKHRSVLKWACLFIFTILLSFRFSVSLIECARKDLFTVAKLIFFSFIAGLLNPYLSIYQSRKSLIQFIYDEPQSLYKELLELTIKCKVLGKCKDDYNELLKIDLRDLKHHMKKKYMHVGFGTQQKLLSILEKDCTTHKDVNKFRIDAKEFLVTLQEKL